MQTAITPSLVFTPAFGAGGTLDFSAMAKFDQRLLYSVFNVTRSTLLYQDGAQGQGTWNAGGTVFTFAANTGWMASTDKLMVVYDQTAAASVTGTLTATGVGSQTGLAVKSDFNMSLWGTFAATIVVERSFDGGTTWLPLTALGTAISFSAPASEIFSEPEAGVQYRVRCSAYTSGTINYRISQ